MRKAVPFYSNRDDDMHCMLAVYASVIEYFWGEKLDWSDLERLTGFEPKKAPWTVKILRYLADRGVDIRMVEPFDYARYEKEGQKYLTELFSREELEWQLKNSNILDIKPLIPDLLTAVTPECRRPNLSDIDNLLDEGRLVFVTLNLKALNNQLGYLSHAVLILDKDGDEYIFHDPGVPPRPYRREKKTNLYKAMGGDNTTSEVTGLKLAS